MNKAEARKVASIFATLRKQRARLEAITDSAVEREDFHLAHGLYIDLQSLSDELNHLIESHSHREGDAKLVVEGSMHY